MKPKELTLKEWELHMPKGGYRVFDSPEAAKNWWKAMYPDGNPNGPGYLVEINHSRKISEQFN